ncbi:MAG: fructose-bisphosphatase class II [Euryarchaeota archaeon]|nr:fructose-bisphosphatase class II [Euryarchaeota archaeon]|tara:strand:+ start:2669 stop:3616 length:948 start_codon:yes stop_codon:yes gene_type:complete
MPVRDLTEDFLRATSSAAVAASSWIGKRDGKAADGAAVEAMRSVFDTIPFDGRVAIGEGERDDAPMLWIGEPLGSSQGLENAQMIDIAVDPLECTNHVAYDLPNAMAVLAAAPRGALLHAPDCYMDKIAGPSILKGEISLEGSTQYNLEATSHVLDCPITELTVVVMDRPRHSDLISSIKEIGADVKLIGDGDIAAALDAADPNSDTDLLMGVGAAPEGVITATALRGLDAPFEGRLVTTTENHQERAVEMVGDRIADIWDRDELCRSSDAVYIGSGVCDGRVPGVRKNSEGNRIVTSEIIDVKSSTRSVVESIL